MKIPTKLQVFDRPIVLPDTDAERLSPYLAYWVKLHRFLLPGVNEPDLQRLIVLELMGKRRKFILNRLLMRLGRVQRHALEAKIARALR